MPEAILEPDLPIIDPHHHLWDRRLPIGRARSNARFVWRSLRGR